MGIGVGEEEQIADGGCEDQATRRRVDHHYPNLAAPAF